MTGYKEYKPIQNVLVMAEKLGFRVDDSASRFTTQQNTMALFATDKLPMHTEDACIYVGSFEDLECWLQGALWAREYDSMVFTVNKKGRSQKYHNAVRLKEEAEYTRRVKNYDLAKRIKTSGII